MQSVENNKPGLSYGYVIVIVGFIIMALIWGTVLSYGLFVKPMSAELGWSRGETSIAYSIAMFLLGALGFPMGHLNDKFGPRFVVMIGGVLSGAGLMLMSKVDSLWQLYLFFGFMCAAGISSGYVPLSSTVARWFSKKRGLMTGIVLAGFGAGNMITPLIVNWLMSFYNWRTTFFILGVFTMVAVLICAQFVRRAPPAQAPAQNEGKNNNPTSAVEFKSFSLKEASLTRQFWLLWVLNITFGAGQMAISVHLAPYATDLGITTAVAAGILSVMGVLNTAGRIGFGIVTDRLGVKTSLLITLVMVLVALAWLPLSTSVWMIMIFAVIFGLGTSGPPAMMPPVVAELFGLKSHGAILGMTALAWGIGAAIGPSLTGYIFDSTQSYRIAFIILAALGVGSVILASPLKPIGKNGWLKT